MHCAQADEAERITYLENALQATLKKLVVVKKRPIFTTALIAGDSVLLDAIAKAGLLDKIDVIFIDTFFLFPESNAFIKELEEHYGFKAKVRHTHMAPRPVVQNVLQLDCPVLHYYRVD